MSAERMSFSYPEEMKKILQKLAKEDDRKLSSYIQKVLTDHINKKKAEKAKGRRKGRRK